MAVGAVVSQVMVSATADGARLAAWSRDLMAYVKLGPEMTLVVARAGDGHVLWTENLGTLPGESARVALIFAMNQRRSGSAR